MRFFAVFIFFMSHVFAINCNNSSIYKSLKHLRGQCSQKKVHLTFDDGPDPRVTPKLLDSLNSRGVKASFYISTHHLKQRQKSQLLKNMIEQGHIVANHGHDHHAHDLRIVKKNDKYYCDSKILSAAESERQIRLSINLLSHATDGLFDKQKHQLFRFPYGRGVLPSSSELAYVNRYGGEKKACSFINGRKSLMHSQNLKHDLNEYRRYRSQALQRVHAFENDHVGWNFDSRDSETAVVNKAKKDPYWYKKNIVQRLCEDSNNSIVALFHDNNKMFNADAMADIIDVGKCLGIKYVDYDEILKQRVHLANSGVILEAPRASGDALGEFISNLFEPGKLGEAPIRQCNESQETKQCRSAYDGRYYSHCQGSKSICVHGEWIARNNVKEVGRHCPTIYNTCYSQYSKTMYHHCQGRNSICIDGVWFGKDTPEVNEYCDRELF